MEGISIWSLIILLAILMLVFGTKKIRGLGSDLGHSIKSFKDAVSGKDEPATSDTAKQIEQPTDK